MRWPWSRRWRPKPTSSFADRRIRAVGKVDLDAIRSSAARQPVWVLADKLRMRQVLVNLLSNAVKYNRIGGTVTLTWDGNDEHWIGAHRGQRARHDVGEAGTPVRALQPARRREIEHRGHRHRPGSVASPRRADGGRPPDLEHARSRYGGHARPQDHRGALVAARARSRRPASTARSAAACACSMPRTTRSTSS